MYIFEIFFCGVDPLQRLSIANEVCKFKEVTQQGGKNCDFVCTVHFRAQKTHFRQNHRSSSGESNAQDIGVLWECWLLYSCPSRHCKYPTKEPRTRQDLSKSCRVVSILWKIEGRGKEGARIGDQITSKEKCRKHNGPAIHEHLYLGQTVEGPMAESPFHLSDPPTPHTHHTHHTPTTHHTTTTQWTVKLDHKDKTLLTVRNIKI